LTRTARPRCSSSNTRMSFRPGGHSRPSILRCVSFTACGPLADPPSGPILSCRFAYRVFCLPKLPPDHGVLSGPLVHCHFVSEKGRLFVMIGSGVRISLSAPIAYLFV